MKKVANNILVSLLFALSVAACRSPVPSGDPFAMADRFTAAFLVECDPGEMARYCDRDGKAYIDTAFLAVERRSPEMYRYLTAWTRGMGLAGIRRPFDIPADSISAPVAPEEASTDSVTAAVPAPAVIPSHVRDIELAYDIVSSKDKSFTRHARVFLRKDEKGRWKVYGCDLSLFW